MSGQERRSRSGQVLVVVLLGTVVLAGLVFYVINVGDQLNRRVTMQNAADSAAISGASWMARSMNIIGMNNVAQTRMLTLVPILDAFPLSVQMACEEVHAWVRCLEAQTARPLPDSFLRDGLQSLKERLESQEAILYPLDQFFNHSQFNMEEVTFWALQGGSQVPGGRLWQAAQSLDEMSQAAAASASVLAQSNAVRYGERNDAKAAFVVPVLPILPARRTQYADFERPIRTGRIPDHADVYRLGPYDRLFKWRDYQYHHIRERDHYVPPRSGATRGSTGNVNVSGRTRGRSARGHASGGHWTYHTVGTILLGYKPYGPFEWMLRRIHDYALGHWHSQGYYPGQLADTFFHEYHKQISNIKLDYMWTRRPSLVEIHKPQWVTDYPTAKTLAERSDVRVTQTMFYVVEIRSRYPKDHALFLSPKSFVTNAKLPIAVWVDGWEDPGQWSNGNVSVPQIAEWVWEDQYSYETTWDPQIGIDRQTDAAGQPIWQPVYMVAQYVFGGIDVGGEVRIRNPANFDDPDDLPAPILIDTAYGDYDPSQPHHDLGVRRDVFTYLGVARRSDSALVWPQRFSSGSPFGSVLALAQAEIFNTSSWDLWTQDWKAKLVPVTRLDDWAGRMSAGAADAAGTQGMVDGNEVSAIQRYLARFSPEMTDMMLHH